MKLFAKFRISVAKDSGQALPPALQNQVERSGELQTFAKHIEAVETALREQRSDNLEVPPDLHSSIMTAVRQQRGQTKEHSKFRFSWWLPAPAMAALLIWALIHFWPGSMPPRNGQAAFSSAVSSVEKGMEIARTAPEEVVAPLSEELKRLRGDVNNAKAFLMASLP